MSPQAQRIEIAKACGFSDFCLQSVTLVHSREVMWDDRSRTHVVFPDYLNDLNAMHEAEKAMANDKLELFVGNLCNILDQESRNGGDNEFKRIHATAPQRAEALLRTIGKWEEAK